MSSGMAESSDVRVTLQNHWHYDYTRRLARHLYATIWLIDNQPERIVMITDDRENAQLLFASLTCHREGYSLPRSSVLFSMSPTGDYRTIKHHILGDDISADEDIADAKRALIAALMSNLS